MCDRIGYFFDLYFPNVSHYPMIGAHILSHKIKKVLVFPWGFFQGFLPRKLHVQCVWFPYYASADLFILIIKNQ
jgi:hypothetical protein